MEANNYYRNQRKKNTSNPGSVKNKNYKILYKVPKITNIEDRYIPFCNFFLSFQQFIHNDRNSFITWCPLTRYKKERK